jgi:alkanesulfonate monooxygenase SsuD/methylene tetrahydromethanopterin reductase-like flavin-dependent oxidoreductase (luciferase family)
VPVGVGVAVGYAGAPFTESVELAEAADAAGLDFVAVGDASADTFALLGAIAVRTRRTALLSGIATWSRTPVTTALAGKTVSNLCDGRYRLGVGPMPRHWAEDWHGLGFARPVERMRDFIMALRAALAARPEAPAQHAGRYFPVRNFPGHPGACEHAVPIYLAATQPRMTELAGEIADGVIFNSINSRDWLAGPGREALAAGGRRGARRPDVGVLRVCGIDEDPAAAYDLARPGLAFYFTVPYFADQLRHGGFDEELAAGSAAAAAGDWDGQVAAVSDRLVDAMALAGTPAEVRAKLAAYDGVVDWIELAGSVGHPPQVARTQIRRIIDTFATAGQDAR